MTRSVFPALALAAAALLPSCQYGPCLRGDGPVVEETRVLEPFDRVVLRSSADLLLIPDSVFRVDVYAQANILDRVRTEVSGGELRVDLRDCVTNTRDIRAEIHAPSFRGLVVDGSGDVENAGTISVPAFDLAIRGSGDVALKLLTDALDTDIDGSGDVRLEGGAMAHSVRIRGSGNVRAFDLACEDATVDVDGSGDVRLRAESTLDVTIRGSGDVYYKGYPAITVDIDGSGDLIDAN